jgi:hypothetical protein
MAWKSTRVALGVLVVAIAVAVVLNQQELRRLRLCSGLEGQAQI